MEWLLYGYLGATSQCVTQSKPPFSAFHYSLGSFNWFTEVAETRLLGCAKAMTLHIFGYASKVYHFSWLSQFLPAS